MDAVVYQEHSREVTLAIKGFKIVTVAFTLAAVVIGIVFGIIDARAGLFILDIVAIGLVVSAAFLWNWYDKDGLQDKFKLLLILILVTSYICNICIFVYGLGARPPKVKPDPDCIGLYDLNTQKCRTFPAGQGNIDNCSLPNYCAFFSGLKGCCGNCSGDYKSCIEYKPTPKPPTPNTTTAY